MKEVPIWGLTFSLQAFHEVCRESLFLLRRNHQPPQKITLHTALLSVTGQNGHSADCPDVPLRGSKS